MSAATETKVMPVISKFYGIIVRLMRLPGRPAAIYANYGEHEVIMDASTLKVISGSAPRRVVEMVCEWARQHQDELRAAIDRVTRLGAPVTIAPLQ
jgi:hypothetical protein